MDENQLTCHKDFECFEQFYDTLVDRGHIENIEVVSCVDFHALGTIEEIANKIKTDRTVKLCRFLANTMNELKIYGIN